MDRGAWSATVHRVESKTTLSFPGSSDGKESACSTGDLGSISPAPLEKAMASHSSILAWKIP